MLANGLAHALRKLRYLLIPWQAPNRLSIDTRQHLIDNQPFQRLPILDVAI
jgi:hypothetical protein